MRWSWPPGATRSGWGRGRCPSFCSTRPERRGRGARWTRARWWALCESWRHRERPQPRRGHARGQPRSARAPRPGPLRAPQPRRARAAHRRLRRRAGLVAALLSHQPRGRRSSSTCTAWTAWPTRSCSIPGAWTHYSYAIRDALELTRLPAIEVHLSDIENREPWRKHSVLERRVRGPRARAGPRRLPRGPVRSRS